MAPGTKGYRPGAMLGGAGRPGVVALEDDVVEFFAVGGRPDAGRVNAALREYIATRQAS